MSTPINPAAAAPGGQRFRSIARRCGRIVIAAAFVAAVLLAPSSAHADYPDEGPSADLNALKDRIESDDAATAEAALRAILAERPDDADVLNLLGYANRKLARYAEARASYVRALTLAPRHRGALEYMGELELETGDPDAARRLLARLRRVCPAGCEELDDLEAAFAQHGL